VLALDAKGDKDARISIERYQQKVDNFVTNIVSKLTLVRLFPLGHKLVHSTSKGMYNSVL
jgi:hypothetical protein